MGTDGGVSPGINRPGREAEPLIPLNAEVNWWSQTLLPRTPSYHAQGQPSNAVRGDTVG